MGMDEQIGGDGVAVIEWFERAPECLPQRALRIDICPLDAEKREITLTPLGGFPKWEDMR